MVADSKQTLLCSYLSAVLLGGLLLNATLGWSWADPLAEVVIAAVVTPFWPPRVLPPCGPLGAGAGGGRAAVLGLPAHP